MSQPTDRDPLLSADYDAGRLAERERIVTQLRFLASARREYFNGDEPQHSGDLDAMRAGDLLVWCESKTAGQLADVLAGDNDAKGWLPSWRWSEWESLTTVTPPEAGEGEGG